LDSPGALRILFCFRLDEICHLEKICGSSRVDAASKSSGTPACGRMGNADRGAKLEERQGTEHDHAVQYSGLIAIEVFMPPTEKHKEQYDDDRQL
jgi:hypothetical protein